MLKPNSWPNSSDSTSPDYLGLVEFLVRPLLESPAFLSVDCEQVNKNQRILIRLAFENNDKRRTFGRSERNIRAIRMVLQVAATVASQSLYLDIYHISEEKSQSSYRTDYRADRKVVRKKNRTYPPPSPRLSVRAHWEQ